MLVGISMVFIFGSEIIFVKGLIEIFFLYNDRGYNDFFFFLL